MSKSAFRKRLLGIPVLGRVLSIGSNVVGLPQTRAKQDIELQETHNKLAELGAMIKELSNQTSNSTERVAAFQNVQDNVQKQLGLLEKSIGSVTDTTLSRPSTSSDALFADDHLLDVFYTNFEDKFRGNEATIEEMLKVYLPYFTKGGLNFKKNPVLDIGSGRGEFLRLLKANEIPSLGLDINIDMVERANNNDLETKQGEALEFLEDTKNQTYGAITGFHIVEHIPFPALLKIFKEAHRCLVNDGFVIFETPNPENIVVGTSTFYLDPSHLRPLPPLLLSFALENSGFRKVETLRLHPDDPTQSKGVSPKLSKFFYGPRDYAVIAYK